MNIFTNLSSHQGQDVNLHVMAIKKMVGLKAMAVTVKLMKMQPLLLVLKHGTWEPRDRWGWHLNSIIIILDKNILQLL